MEASDLPFPASELDAAIYVVDAQSVSGYKFVSALSVVDSARLTVMLSGARLWRRWRPVCCK